MVLFLFLFSSASAFGMDLSNQKIENTDCRNALLFDSFFSSSFRTQLRLAAKEASVLMEREISSRKDGKFNPIVVGSFRRWKVRTTKHLTEDPLANAYDYIVATGKIMPALYGLMELRESRRLIEHKETNRNSPGLGRTNTETIVTEVLTSFKIPNSKAEVFHFGDRTRDGGVVLGQHFNLQFGNDYLVIVPDPEKLKTSAAMRTFLEARQLTSAQDVNRGFCLIAGLIKEGIASSGWITLRNRQAAAYGSPRSQVCYVDSKGHLFDSIGTLYDLKGRPLYLGTALTYFPQIIESLTARWLTDILDQIEKK
ncbi:MAG: hypothetical protein AB7F43_06165 [Bacteriovoracia bacterium]